MAENLGHNIPEDHPNFPRSAGYAPAGSDTEALPVSPAPAKKPSLLKGCFFIAIGLVGLVIGALTLIMAVALIL